MRIDWGYIVRTLVYMPLLLIGGIIVLCVLIPKLFHRVVTTVCHKLLDK